MYWWIFFVYSPFFPDINCSLDLWVFLMLSYYEFFWQNKICFDLNLLRQIIPYVLFYSILRNTIFIKIQKDLEIFMVLSGELDYKQNKKKGGGNDTLPFCFFVFVFKAGWTLNNEHVYY